MTSVVDILILNRNSDSDNLFLGYNIFVIVDSRVNINLSFDGYDFQLAASSNHPHRRTSLGKIESGLVAISGYGGGREVELYTDGSWISQTPFPAAFCNYCDSFDSYSTSTFNNELYVFGE